MAVDFYPGETVQPTGLTYNFTLTSGPCSGNLTTCHSPEDLNKMLTGPSTECSSAASVPQLRLGSPITAGISGFPNRKKMPVWVDGPNSSFSWNEIDFLLSVAQTVGQSMLAPTIEGNLIPSSAVQAYAVGTQYRVYAHQKGTVHITNGSPTTPNANNTLFYIVFDGPQLESECADIMVDFADRGRIDGGDFSCCKPKKGSSNHVSWTGANCVTATCPKVVLKAAHSPYSSSGSCGNVLYFDVYVSTAETTTNLSDVSFVLKIKKNGSFTLNSTLTSSPYCSAGTCVTVSNISSDYLRVVYSVSGLTNLVLDANSVYSSVRLVTIALNTLDYGCIDDITFLDAVIKNNGSTNACLPRVQSEFMGNNPSDDICVAGLFVVNAADEFGVNITDWDYYVDYKNISNFSSCQYKGTSEPNLATASRCVCLLPNVEQNVVLKKDDNYLNGVSTYDLVLISRHILGLTPLAGFNILAGDANMSGNPTTIDIVELRRLILGIYQTALPHANSWRFIDKDLKGDIQANANPFSLIGSAVDYSISTPAIPSPSTFFSEEFEEFAFPANSILSPPLDSKAEFVGFKVGDVNNNALPNFNQLLTADRSVEVIDFGARSVSGQAGETVELPIFNLKAQTLSGWQMALQFDTSLLQVTGLRWPAEFPIAGGQDRGWNLAKPGELRALWFDARKPSFLDAGSPVFFVQARLRQDLRHGQSLFQLASSIPAEAYGTAVQPYRLALKTSTLPLLPVPQIQEKSVQAEYRLIVYPNPADSYFRVEIEASVATAARLEICNLLGQAIATRPLTLLAGLNTVASTSLPTLTPRAVHY